MSLGQKQQRSIQSYFTSIGCSAPIEKEKSKPKHQEPDTKRQRYLDVGQKNGLNPVRCKGCGMLYTPGLDSEEKEHHAFHLETTMTADDQLSLTLHFKGWKNERVVSSESKLATLNPTGLSLRTTMIGGDSLSRSARRTVMVMKGDPQAWIVKVLQVVEALGDHLSLPRGSALPPSGLGPDVRVFLSLNPPSQSIDGVLVMERLSTPPSTSSRPPTSSISNRSDGNAVGGRGGDDVRERDKQTPLCRVGLAWIDDNNSEKSVEERRVQRRALIDVGRLNLIHGYVIPSDRVEERYMDNKMTH